MKDANPRRRRLDRRRAVIVTVGLIAGASAGAGPRQGPDEKAGAALVPRGLPVSAETRKDILHRVLTHPGVAPRASAHRLAVIRMRLGTTTDASRGTRTIATVILFDHTAGEARRVLLDVHSGELLANTPLRGRPQGSREEFDEAAQIIRLDPGLARLLDEGAVLDGGFIVADPGGSRRRMMQLKLLSTDRLRLLRTITVDLTRRAIASPAEQGMAAASGATATAPGVKRAIR
jgi:hypothetical protein